MSTQQQNLEALQDIRKMMDRSSRFISLSGWSGIVAGAFALAGAGFASQELSESTDDPALLQASLINIAALVFAGAFISAIVLTYFKSRKQGVAFWGPSAKRLVWNTLLPMIAGGLLIWRMIQQEQFELVPATSLIIYGLALINGSKFTLGEVRYLGYAELLVGIICLWNTPMNLFFWAFGFGILHIFYGIAMWYKYERRAA
jgi:heme/copper-type cytochrome/quinol oxidase subunit 3